MPVFEVYLDGEKVAVSGLEREGILTTMLTWCRRPDDAPGPREELELAVSGLDSPSDEHLEWFRRAIEFGSEIRIRPLETGIPMPPLQRRAISPEGRRKHKEAYVRKMAAELGWDIIESEAAT